MNGKQKPQPEWSSIQRLSLCYKRSPRGKIPLEIPCALGKAVIRAGRVPAGHSISIAKP